MQKTTIKELRGTIALLIAACVWGIAFVAQSVGAQKVGPFTFLCLRSFLGGIVLLPLIALRSTKKEQNNTVKGGHTLWMGGLLCGFCLFIASYFQQAGIAYTSVGNAGFITALYILMVPVLGLFFGKKVQGRLWLCIGLAVVALYLLTIKEGLRISAGDSLVMLCALVFSGHILLVDRFSPHVDGVKLACIQFFVVALLSLLPMLLLERPLLSDVKDAWLSIAYAGVMSSGVGYTLQIIGQKYTRPAVASLVMSLESVFAVLAGVVVLGQIPSVKEGIGCALMFAAIILAQVPEKRKAA